MDVVSAAATLRDQMVVLDAAKKQTELLGGCFCQFFIY